MPRRVSGWRRRVGTGDSGYQKPLQRAPGSGMNIHQSFAAPPPAKPRVSGDRGALLTALVHLWPYIWPSDRRDLKLRVRAGDRAFVSRQARHHRGAVHVQMGDRRACCARHSRRSPSLMAWAIAAPVAAHARLRRHAHPDGAADPVARRHVRQGRDARGAAARAHRPSSTCTCCRCASIWSARPAA